eukprot:TRINITY_DN340_c0_g1_i4.p1 TRINITY_DN340_c0_g1~~TRINITY_DN340_c0_g1_i4.p1  ORF type:complete len:213 (-),score=32.59 TRINITY_DN340_c0_g1_i4:259-897(-)
MAFLPSIRHAVRAGVQRSSSLRHAWSSPVSVRHFASVPDKVDFSTDVNLQKARTWDEGLQSNFSTTSMKELFGGKKVVVFGLPGAFTGVCSAQHVPSYLKRADELKSKGVDKIVCVAVNDPYCMKGWAKSLNAEDKIEFYGDFDARFNKMLGLDMDLSSGLLGHRSKRYSMLVDDGKIKVLNVEEVPSNFKVSDADTILKSLWMCCRGEGGG